MHTSRMTRAIALCGTALFGGASVALAQTDMGMSPRRTPGFVQFGLEGGASIANFIGSDAGNSKNRTGLYGGLTMLIQPQTSAIGFQTGVLYVEKGAKANNEPTNIGNLTGSINLRYIEVPVLVRIGVPMSFAGVSPTIMAGASLGYRVGCRIETSGTGFNSSFDCDDALGEDDFDTKRFDGGVSVGVEIPVAVGSSFILVPSVRYIRSLTNVVNGSNNDIKNSNVLIGVGFRFR